MTPHRGSREFGGADPLDRQLGAPPRPLLGRKRDWLRSVLQRRAAFGLRPGVTPAVILIPAGFALGPRAANLLTLDVLAHMQVGISLGLALLGVFVGRALARELRNVRLLAAGNLESAVTILVVGFALWFLITRSHVPVGAGALLVAVSLGVTAAASAAHIDDRSDPSSRLAARVADFDDLLLIVIGAVLLVWIRATYGPVSGVLYLAPLVIGGAVALAGLLLFEHAEGEAERGLLVLGAVALIGGASAYLMTSSLAAGMIAGLIWTLTPGTADEILERSARNLQHPLVALLLVAAGAFFVPRAEALWLLAPYVLFRLVGKMAGAAAAAPLLAGVRSSDLTGYLIPPGVIGIGFSLSFMLALPADAGEIVVSVAAAGTFLSEIIALVLFPAPGPAPEVHPA